MWISLSAILAICCLQATMTEGLFQLKLFGRPVEIRLNNRILSTRTAPSRQLSGNEIFRLLFPARGPSEEVTCAENPTPFRPTPPTPFRPTPPTPFRPTPPIPIATTTTEYCEDDESTTPEPTCEDDISSTPSTVDESSTTEEICEDDESTTPEPTCEDDISSTPSTIDESSTTEEICEDDESSTPEPTCDDEAESTTKSGYITFNVKDLEPQGPPVSYKDPSYLAEEY